MTLKRIHREIADLKKEDLGPIVLEPAETNLYVWKGSIPGPPGSLYEGGVFNVEIALPSDYPYVSTPVCLLIIAELTSFTSGSRLQKYCSKLGKLGTHDNYRFSIVLTWGS
jgi:hypothetical protein